ncbi:MAG: CoA transferase [Chloroflexota bacterium]|nr:CoA transferase [Chloroflexota bacterium]
MAGPLEGIRILDFTRYLAGPVATSFLGDLGADVIKIERPGLGDDVRKLDRVFGADVDSGYFVGNNRSKRSLTLDLSDVRGREIVLRLIGTTDVLIENFRVGVMERLKLGYEQVREINSRLVYCSVTSFGSHGPYAHKPGMDIIVQAMGGVMGLTGNPDGPPMRSGSPIGDFLGAYQSLFGIMTALFHRERTGEGQLVEIALLDGQVSLLANYVPGFFVTGKPDRPVGNGHPQIVPYQAFDTADGHMIVAVLNESFWRKLCEVLDMPQMMDDPRFAKNADRVDHRDELVPILQERFAERPTHEWAAVLEAADVPCAPVQDLADIARDPQVRENEMLVKVQHPTAGEVTVVGTPIKLRGTPSHITRPAPLLGQHTDEILRELGFQTAEIEALRDDGVV